MNVLKQICIYYIHYSSMRAFLEHLFWADKQYLEKHALYLFILLPGFRLTMGDMKVFLSSTFAFQICEIQIAWNHDVILTISPYSSLGYSSAVVVLCCIDNPLEKTSVTARWVWWYLATYNAPQHEDITKDETLLTCRKRAVRSLSGVLTRGPGLQRQTGEIEQELISS